MTLTFGQKKGQREIVFPAQLCWLADIMTPLLTVSSIKNNLFLIIFDHISHIFIKFYA